MAERGDGDRQPGPDAPRRAAAVGEWSTARSAVACVAELTGTGPLEPFMTDPLVEEIDVNSHLSTWVTYADGRKIDVGQLWESPADLTAYQKRLARRMTGTGEGRLDTQSPMLTFQADDGSRVVMVLGGRGRARHLDPSADRHPPLRAAPRRPRRPRPTRAVPGRPGAAAASDGAMRLHDPGQRAAGCRQDDAC